MNINWINYDYTDRVILFSKIEVSNQAEDNFTELASWTVEECDPGHFLLSFESDTVGLGKKLRCYITSNDESRIVAIVSLDSNIEQGYFYSFRIEYPSSGYSFGNIKLKSVDTTAELEEDQIFVFDTHRHSHTTESKSDLYDPYTVKDVLTTGQHSEYNDIFRMIIENFGESTDQYKELADDYYTLIGD